MSKIKWTEKTEIIDRGGRRVRLYVRKTMGPPKRVRAEMSAQGKAWCPDCADWRPIGEVRKGLCKTHILARERARYAEDPDFRNERRNRAALRKRGVERVPAEGVENLSDEFDGRCAYCPAAATTWDHVVAVTKDGSTEPGNMLPACGPCNSSKGNRDLWEWLEETGRQIAMKAVERLAHYQVSL